MTFFQHPGSVMGKYNSPISRMCHRAICLTANIFVGSFAMTAVAHAETCSGKMCIATDRGETNISITSDQALKVTGRITTPYGSVEIKEGSSSLGSGGNPYTTSLRFDPGVHTIKAYNPIEGSSPTITVTVTKASSASVTVTLPKTNFDLVEGATVSATIRGYRLSGYVTFQVVNDTTNETLDFPSVAFGSTAFNVIEAPVTGGVGFPRGGNNHVVVRYTGNDYNAPVATSVPVTVNKGSSATAIESSLKTVVEGKPVSLSAKVRGVNVTGAVSFYDGTVLLGTAPLVKTTSSNDILSAVLPVTFKGMRSHGVTAVYSGDLSNLASTSAPLSVSVINPGVISTILQLLDD